MPLVPKSGGRRAVVLLTDDRGLRYATSANSAFANSAVHAIAAGTFSARRPLKSVAAVFQIVAGIVQAWTTMRRARPALVIGFGGYPSLLPMIAAGWLGVPRLIHEQNAVLGKVNRLFAGRVTAIATSFEVTDGVSASQEAKVTVTGNPVRQDIAEVGGQPYGTVGEALNILILGGSQGAEIMDEVVPKALAGLSPEIRNKLKVSHQCRLVNKERVARENHAADVEADVASFFDDIPARLGPAHIVIARAGASTVAELSAAGRPAILVPYPGHGDRQQAANAKELAEAGGAWMIEQPAFDAARLTSQLRDFAADPAVLVRAAAAARTTGHENAASALADLAERQAA